MSRERYMQLLRKSDPRIAALLDQGFAFATNAFRPGQAPPGIPAQDCEQMAARLRREGWEVMLATAYDEAGQALSHMASLWQRKPK
jgi:fructose-1-phosphate kinase PfkB-like protein